MAEGIVRLLSMSGGLSWLILVDTVSQIIAAIRPHNMFTH